MLKNAMTIIKERTAVEAGYVNNNLDLGGPTNHGITYATMMSHTHLWNQFNFAGDIKEMPVELAYAIYKESWWDKMRLDEVIVMGVEGVWLAERLFDFGINCGRGKAVEAVQRWLNVLNRNGKDYPDMVVDGGLGPTTIKAIYDFSKRNADGLHKLYHLVSSSQDARYLEISEARVENETFTNGWTTRVLNDVAIYWKNRLGLLK